MSDLRDNHDASQQDPEQPAEGRKRTSVGPEDTRAADRTASRTPIGTTARERLIASMGLAYDPFSSGVTEKDLTPDFGAIYVDVQPALLASLLRPEPSLVFARAGMGKTATRLALEFALRQARTPRRLCVTYLPQVSRLGSLDQEEQDDEQLLMAHLRELTREARVDLLVQYSERLPERERELASPWRRLQQQALWRTAQSVPHPWIRLLRKANDDPGTDGIFWRGLRPVVRHVGVTSTWRSLLQTLATASRTPAERAATWEDCLYDARALGFGATYVLLDAVDDGSFEAEAFFHVIRPLVAAMAELQSQAVFLKLFLPLSVKSLIESYLHALTPSPEVATIETISEKNLHRLVGERFVAASLSTASFRGLDWLGNELNESVEERLVALAAGSPRQLIELASALLDYHSVHGFRDGERLWLKPAEWRAFLDAI